MQRLLRGEAAGDARPTLLIDARRCITYHGPMTNDDSNTPQPDPLTIGELISLQEAAEYARLTRDALQGYIRRGRLKAKKVGPIWVTTRAAVDNYLQSRRFENIPKKYRRD
jgi:excisionase family DNA binding protein